MSDNQNQYEFYLCSRSEALKIVGDFISESRKDREAIKTRRVRTSTSLATVLGIAISLVIQGNTNSAFWARVGAIIGASGVINYADVSLGKKIFYSKHLLRAAEALQTHITMQSDDKISMPTDLHAFLNDIAKQNSPIYRAIKDKTNLVIRGCTIAVGGLSIIFASAHSGLDKKVTDFITEALKQDSSTQSSGLGLDRNDR